MKNTLPLLLLLSISLSAADLRLGFKAGFNSGIANTNVPVVEQTKHRRSSFHVGGLADVSFNEHFSLQPQVLYSGEGVKFEAPDHGHVITMYSLDIPVNLVYKTKPGFFVGAGPNFGINLRGTNRVTGDHPMTVAYKFGSDPFDYKRFDFGVNFMAGYQHPKGYFTSFNYVRGISGNLVNGAEWSQNVASFSFGYTFKPRR